MFLDDVRVPQSNRVGPENEGWTVAKYLLEFERGGGGAATRLQVGLDHLRSIAEQQLSDGRPLIEDAEFARRLSELEIARRSLEFSELETLARVSAGGSPGAGFIARQELVGGDRAGYRSADAGGDRLLRPAPCQFHISQWSQRTLGGPDYAETVTARYLNGRAASISVAPKSTEKHHRQDRIGVVANG